MFQHGSMLKRRKFISIAFGAVAAGAVGVRFQNSANLPRLITMSYAGESPHPHPQAGSPTCRGVYRPTFRQVRSLLESIRMRLPQLPVMIRDGEKNPRLGVLLNVRTRAINDSSFCWSLLLCSVNYEITDRKGYILTSGICEGRCSGPAGPQRRIGDSVKAKFLLPLCGRAIGDRVANYFYSVRGDLVSVSANYSRALKANTSTAIS